MQYDYDHEILIKTLFLEAGSTINKVTSIEDVIAVGWNIRNRFEKQKKRFGLTVAGVCLKRLQYSCWNGVKPADIKIGNSLPWKICKTVTEYVINAPGKLNPIPGVTHYFNPNLCQPRWAKDMREQAYTPVLNHTFHVE